MSGEREDPAQDAAEPVVTLCAQAATQLAALVHAVDRVHGRVEFGVLLFGRERSIEQVVLIEGQSVSVVSFAADCEAVERSVVGACGRFPELSLIGIAHRHPGRGAIAVGHSAIDEDALLDGLCDQICARAGNLSWVEREVDISASETARVRIELASGEPATGARLYARVRVGEALSLVFDAAGEAMECVVKRVVFAPMLGTGPYPHVVRLNERVRAAVRVEAAAGDVDEVALEEEVRRAIAVEAVAPRVERKELDS